ncbi:MAG TPA: flagellar biosynthesis protein FlhF [Firmicutes bacterium]|nr:flagellar biosynthesis protein FlhF [Bacillota bacterium]
MRVKRYVGWDVQEALKKVKKELGEDAVILRVKKIPWPGFLNLFLRERAEIIAASGADIAIGAGAGVPASVPPLPGTRTAGCGPASGMQPQLPPEDQDRRVAGHIPGGIEQSARESLSALKNELAEIKSAIKELSSKKLETLDDGVADGQKGFKSATGRRLYQLLTDQGIDPELARLLVRAALKAAGRKSPAGVSPEALLVQVIQGEILTSGPLDGAAGGSRTIVLVGPTGVGKTTTIAKLAARFGIIEKKKVSLVTADTYRVAAVDQLRTYAEIMGIELAVVHTPQEMRAEIARLRGAGSDLVLVDTAGRSPRKALEIGELKAMVDAARPAEVHLVLSIATRSRDLLDTVARFSPVGIDSMIFTKLDETSYLGGLLNVVHQVKKPVSYITMGQNVPDDIEVADAANLTRMILAGGSNERSGWQLATNG